MTLGIPPETIVSRGVPTCTAAAGRRMTNVSAEGAVGNARLALGILLTCGVLIGGAASAAPPRWAGELVAEDDGYYYFVGAGLDFQTPETARASAFSEALRALVLSFDSSIRVSEEFRRSGHIADLVKTLEASVAVGGGMDSQGIEKDREYVERRRVRRGLYSYDAWVRIRYDKRKHEEQAQIKRRRLSEWRALLGRCLSFAESGKGDDLRDAMDVCNRAYAIRGGAAPSERASLDGALRRLVAGVAPRLSVGGEQVTVWFAGSPVNSGTFEVLLGYEGMTRPERYSAGSADPIAGIRGARPKWVSLEPDEFVLQYLPDVAQDPDLLSTLKPLLGSQAGRSRGKLSGRAFVAVVPGDVASGYQDFGWLRSEILSGLSRLGLAPAENELLQAAALSLSIGAGAPAGLDADAWRRLGASADYLVIVKVYELNPGIHGGMEVVESSATSAVYSLGTHGFCGYRAADAATAKGFSSSRDLARNRAAADLAAAVVGAIVDAMSTGERDADCGR